jgi:benzylsuccinate CoA-transferase BbsF subunit
MCGLMLAFVAAAALWRRARSGDVASIDFSMVEAMLWTMATPLSLTQIAEPPSPLGNRSARCAPHNAYRASGEDAWVSLAVETDEVWRGLCRIVPGLRSFANFGPEQRLRHVAQIDAVLSEWSGGRTAQEAEALLRREGIPAAALASSIDLLDSTHLRTRGFWEAHGDGLLPGLPWQASFGRQSGPAPALGGDTDDTLRSMLGMDDATVAKLRSTGAVR